jgi:hypothetical protein
MSSVAYNVQSDADLLIMPHTMRKGDKVTFTDRNTHESFQGEIYSIVRLPANKYFDQYNLLGDIDYFYIKPRKQDMHKLLTRGLPIILNYIPCVLGNVDYEDSLVKNVYIQEFLRAEYLTSIRDINAILIWRVAYDIQPV